MSEKTFSGRIISWKQKAEELEAENKEQDIIIEGYSNKTTEQAMEISALRQSRDELLETVLEYFERPFLLCGQVLPVDHVQEIVKKAKDLKKKETK